MKHAKLIGKLNDHDWIFECTHEKCEMEVNREIEVIKKISISLFKWCSFLMLYIAVQRMNGFYL
ncbi:hypothetical protein R6242_19690 [Iodobacter sp. CM08]|uniref:hypothetical protein n=1 Tax=Iodobacter sp. CM08 TaxID=3085902 RepID=UPI002980B398|nr:hypothetical protein [Iodobacter sp. CM08]MDW5418795.1 hypothetical protein [Iodobacter sp. CM08]